MVGAFNTRKINKPYVEPIPNESSRCLAKSLATSRSEAIEKLTKGFSLEDKEKLKIMLNRLIENLKEGSE